MGVGDVDKSKIIYYKRKSITCFSRGQTVSVYSKIKKGFG